MTLFQIVTAIIAVYGALLSTATFILQLRSKRWRVVASFGLARLQGDMPAISVRADNLGERPVMLKTMKIGLGRRRSRADLLARAIDMFTPLYGIREMQSFGTYMVEQPPMHLPAELAPGRSIKLWIGGKDILNYVTSRSRSTDSPVEYIVGIFFDNIGRRYPTPAMRTDLLKSHCGSD